MWAANGSWGGHSRGPVTLHCAKAALVSTNERTKLFLHPVLCGKKAEAQKVTILNITNFVFPPQAVDNV